MPVRAVAIAALAAALAGCVTLTDEPRAIVLRGGEPSVQRLPCDGVHPGHAGSAGALDPGAIRVVTWNIHKQSQAGWQRDLARLVASSDVVLLQEAVLDRELRALVEGDGFGWIMASSFLYLGRDIGVLTASRVAPVAACTERVGEPLIVVPKSSIVSWFALAGRDQPLAVVNLHAINFSLTLGSYDAQLAALAAALADHRGPIVFAGDFNTWTDARRDAMNALAARLGLVETRLADDRRSTFFGHQVDHVLVRGLEPVAVEAIAVRSSDHNPVVATLRVK
jgi:endonuclease/exonuclease/phosphatase (EEP) superfamily protein YafD